MSRALLSAAALQPRGTACALCGEPATARLRRVSRAGLLVSACACDAHECDVAYALWTTTPRDVARRVAKAERLARAWQAQCQAALLVAAARRANARGVSLRGRGAIVWRLARRTATRRARGLSALAAALQRAA